MKLLEHIKKHRYQWTVRYYLALALILAIMFFSGDFGMIDVQKTAIVMAVGVDKAEEEYVVTAQIAMPQSGEDSKAVQTVQVSYQGKTVAEAFAGINAKTGWYPKLVYCKLILLGETTVQNNALDALSFFVLDEYLSDDCLVATCAGEAKTLLSTPALGETTGSMAMQKVLSPHAERVGQVLPNTLREFLIGYHGRAKASFLPILKAEQADPKKDGTSDKNDNSSQSEQGEQSAQGGKSEQNNGSQSGQSGEKSQGAPAFSAGETALFVGGKLVGTLDKEETFAYSTVKNELKLANYTLTREENACTLSIKHNERKRKLHVSKDGNARLELRLTLTAGLLDTAKTIHATDAGDVPNGAFAQAERQLRTQITGVFDKCRNLGCDLFEISSLLEKHENKRFEALQADILQNATVSVGVRFRGVR